MTLLRSITPEEVQVDWLTEQAKEELSHGTLVTEDLYVLEVDEPVLVVGLRYGNLFRAPELWIFLCKGYRPIYLRWSKRMIEELLEKYYKLQVWVRSSNARGMRFAQAHGFETERKVTWEGVGYDQMVARLKWA